MANFQEELEAAEARQTAKREVRAILHALSTQDRRAVLIDMLAEVSSEGAARPALPAVVAVSEAGATMRRKPMAKSPSKGGLKQVAQKHSSAIMVGPHRLTGDLTIKFVRFVERQPDATVPQIAAAVYGRDTPDTRGNVRSLLSVLRTRGVVTKEESGPYILNR